MIDLDNLIGDYIESAKVELQNTTIYVYQSLTFGEMLIALLLSLIIVLILLYWFYEVVR